MKISQAAAELGLSAETLKRWEKQGRVREAARDSKGWRVYGEDDVRLLRGVLRKLHSKFQPHKWKDAKGDANV